MKKLAAEWRFGVVLLVVVAASALTARVSRVPMIVQSDDVMWVDVDASGVIVDYSPEFRALLEVPDGAPLRGLLLSSFMRPSAARAHDAGVAALFSGDREFDRRRDCWLYTYGQRREFRVSVALTRSAGAPSGRAVVQLYAP